MAEDRARALVVLAAAAWNRYRLVPRVAAASLEEPPVDDRAAWTTLVRLVRLEVGLHRRRADGHGGAGERHPGEGRGGQGPGDRHRPAGRAAPSTSSSTRPRWAATTSTPTSSTPTAAPTTATTSADVRASRCPSQDLGPLRPGAGRGRPRPLPAAWPPTCRWRATWTLDHHGEARPLHRAGGHGHLPVGCPSVTVGASRVGRRPGGDRGQPRVVEQLGDQGGDRRCARSG